MDILQKKLDSMDKGMGTLKGAIRELTELHEDTLTRLTRLELAKYSKPSKCEGIDAEPPPTMLFSHGQGKGYQYDPNEDLLQHTSTPKPWPNEPSLESYNIKRNMKRDMALLGLVQGEDKTFYHPICGQISISSSPWYEPC